MPRLDIHPCQEKGRGAPIVERWEPKKVRGTVEPLPKVEGADAVELRGVLARSPTEVLVFGGAGSPRKPYLARFDGKAWSLDKPPFAGGVTALTAADDGTLWAVADGALWKKSAADWAKIELPSAATATGVWARAAADVWVTATTGKGAGLLLRTAKVDAKDVARLPDRKAMAEAVASNRRWIATDACDKVYAHLTTLGPSKDPATGKPADAPKGFSALKPVFDGELAGLQPIVEDDGAHLYIGVPVPSLEVGKKLLAAYREKNPKATPSLFCHEPVIIKQAIKFQ
jgi:hypothetical protein